MKTLIIVPTYNEAINIEKLIAKIFSVASDCDVLVIDDNSPDKTYEIVEGLLKADSRVKLIKREKKLGLGSAYVRGFNFALAKEYDFVFEMDADFSHNPKMIPLMLKACKKHDLVVGSRYIQGTSIVNWPLRRLILSYLASLYVRILTGLRVKDPTSGFKCYRADTLRAIDPNSIKSEGYSFQIETCFKVFKKGLSIKEIPIVFVDRVNGISKMSFSIIVEAIFMVWRLKFFSNEKKDSR